jgi:pyridoxamine 5'-phosphate oxidase
VRIEGTVERVSEEESIEYFKNRPRASQLSARISQQSEVVENRDKLIEKYKEEELKFPNEVPKPHFWGGFKIIPTAFEFWVGQTDRLHDRIRFFKDNKVGEEGKVGEEAKVGDDGWLYQRLQP